MKSEQRADKERTKKRQGAETWRTQRATWETQRLEARPKPTQGGYKARRTPDNMAAKVWRGSQRRHKTKTWQTRFGGAGVAKADSRRTQGGQAPGTRPEHIAASLFFLRENFTVNCLGNNMDDAAMQVQSKNMQTSSKALS